jgi:hypothetical protein
VIVGWAWVTLLMLRARDRAAVGSRAVAASAF